MKVERFSVEITGVTPLICNRFTDAAQMAASNGSRSSAIGDKGSPKDQATTKLYIGADGKKLVIPQPNLFRCIIDGGSFFKAGKSKVTTQKSSLIPACVTIPETEIPIIHEKPWEVDSRAVRIPATGGRIIAHRPLFHDWKLRFCLEVDTEIMTAQLLRDIVDAAGYRVGMGDFRPACKGPFGRFKVDLWQKQN